MKPEVPKAQRVARLGFLGTLLLACTFVATRPSPPKLHAEAATLAPTKSAPRGQEFPDCSVRGGKRVFVGFSDDMTLDDFETAALHADRILKQARVALCRALLGPTESIAAPLQGAVARGQILRITDVLFASRGFGRADVRLQAFAGPDAEQAVDAHARWLARVERKDAAWRVVALSAEKAGAKAL